MHARYFPGARRHGAGPETHFPTWETDPGQSRPIHRPRLARALLSRHFFCPGDRSRAIQTDSPSSAGTRATFPAFSAPGDRSRAIRADPHRSAGCDGVRAAPQTDPRRSRPIRGRGAAGRGDSSFLRRGRGPPGPDRPGPSIIPSLPAPPPANVPVSHRPRHRRRPPPPPRPPQVRPPSPPRPPDPRPGR